MLLPLLIQMSLLEVSQRLDIRECHPYWVTLRAAIALILLFVGSCITSRIICTINALRWVEEELPIYTNLKFTQRLGCVRFSGISR